MSDIAPEELKAACERWRNLYDVRPSSQRDNDALNIAHSLLARLKAPEPEMEWGLRSVIDGTYKGGFNESEARTWVEMFPRCYALAYRQKDWLCAACRKPAHEGGCE